MYSNTSVITCLGRRGSGKSYLAKQIADKYYKRVLVVDIMNDPLYLDDESYLKIKDLGELKTYLLYIARNYDAEFKICFLLDETKENKIEIFNLICNLVYYTKNMLLIIEEAQSYTTTNVDGLETWHENLLTKGRHQKIALVHTTQRVGLLNKTIISQSDHIFVGQLSANSDIQYIISNTNLEKEQIYNLEQRQFIHIDLSETKITINQVSNTIS